MHTPRTNFFPPDILGSRESAKKNGAIRLLRVWSRYSRRYLGVCVPPRVFGGIISGIVVAGCSLVRVTVVTALSQGHCRQCVYPGSYIHAWVVRLPPRFVFFCVCVCFHIEPLFLPVGIQHNLVSELILHPILVERYFEVRDLCPAKPRHGSRYCLCIVMLQ